MKSIVFLYFHCTCEFNFNTVSHPKMSHWPRYRVFLRNLRYDVQKWEVRKVLEDDYGIFTCTEIKLTRMDQWNLPQHCSGHLTLSDVTWILFMWNHKSV